MNFGAIASIPDHRDFMYAKVAAINPKQPKELSLRSSLTTPIKDQGQWGTCVGQAGAGTEESHISADKIPLSAAFLYTMCKAIDGIPTMEGTYPKVAMQIMQKQGVCREATLPYNTITDVFHLPTITDLMKTEAQRFRLSAYAKVSTLVEMRQALISDGAVLGALVVCENFDPQGGRFIPMPEGAIRGGHAVMVTGYDDDMQYKYSDGHVCTGFLEIRNSWGLGWGDGGYTWVPYEYFSGRTDLGMPYWMESWSSVDLMLPPRGAEHIIVKVGSNIAIVDGVEVLMDQPAFIDQKSGRTLVPLRLLSENMGYRVRWDGVNSAVILSR